MKIILLIGICILLVLVGCDSERYQYTCRNVDTDEYATVYSSGRVGSEEYTLEECRRKVCNVVIKKV